MDVYGTVFSGAYGSVFGGGGGGATVGSGTTLFYAFGFGWGY